MKYIFTLSLCLGFFCISNSYGQEASKKVIVIKEVKDKNGKITKQRQEASGQEADLLIKQLKEDESLNGIDLDIEIEKARAKGRSEQSSSDNISISKSIVNGKEITSYKIIKEVNGEQQVLEWDGKGEMPAEMAEIMKDIDINTEQTNNGKDIEITVNTENSDSNTKIIETHTIESIIEMHPNDNKVSLGIILDDGNEGVIINTIIEDSAAKNSDLKVGDTILKINEDYVFNTEMLLKALSKFDKGDSANITYLRSGKEKKTIVKF